MYFGIRHNLSLRTSQYNEGSLPIDTGLLLCFWAAAGRFGNGPSDSYGCNHGIKFIWFRSGGPHPVQTITRNARLDSSLRDLPALGSSTVALMAD